MSSSTAAPPAYGYHPAEVRRAWDAMIAPGQVTELRCLCARVRGEYRTGIYSGYFDDCDAIIAALDNVDHATGCYFVPNPCNPALLARANNHARIITGKEPTTSDHDIACRRWLLVDVDPVRPAGISATDAEKNEAYEIAVAIDNYLWEGDRGIAPGIIADSGNGAHLMLPIDMPADSTFPQAMLKHLAGLFDIEKAKIDISVFNAARIWKLPGTMSCKGDHAPDIGRPWRMAKITTIMKDIV